MFINVDVSLLRNYSVHVLYFSFNRRVLFVSLNNPFLPRPL